MLKDIWRVLTGRLSWEMLEDVRHARILALKAAAYQLNRANEAVRLYNDCEIARKQSSDALGNVVMKQMLGDK